MVQKIIANLPFLLANLDDEIVKNVATPTNATRVNNPALATPTNATIANDPAPTNPTMVSTSKAGSLELVDYGNDKLFANLARVHDYYYEWRAQHLDVDVWDGSPAFVNFSASQFTEVLEKQKEPHIHVYSMITTLGRRVCWQCKYRRQGIGQKNNCKSGFLMGNLGC